MKKIVLFCLLAVASACFITTCGDSIVVEKTTENWLVNPDELYKRGLIEDYIFPIDIPFVEQSYRATYIGEYDPVIGTEVDNQYTAYPYFILSRHEVINDQIGDVNYSVIYCPFTNLGTVWSRQSSASSSLLGVADLVFNNSHIISDRNFDCYWLPMKQQCIYGDDIGETAPIMRSIETVWSTWLEMYPESDVVSIRTGFDYDYSEDPYPSHNADNDLLYFPINKIDGRLNNKDKIHAMVDMNSAKVYSQDSFPDTVVTINDTFNSAPVVVIGTNTKKLFLSYSRTLADNTVLSFEPVQESLPSIMTDNEGNTWDIWGKAVSGPRTGTYLNTILSYNCYWYALAAIFDNIEIVQQ